MEPALIRIFIVSQAMRRSREANPALVIYLNLNPFVRRMALIIQPRSTTGNVKRLHFNPGLLDNLPGGLRGGCCCFGIVEQPGLEVLKSGSKRLLTKCRRAGHWDICTQCPSSGNIQWSILHANPSLWRGAGCGAWVAGANPVIPVSPGARSIPLVARIYPDEIMRRMPVGA